MNSSHRPFAGSSTGSEAVSQLILRGFWLYDSRTILDEEHMTLLEACFNYRLPPGERELGALDRIRQVYGVRKMRFDERARIIRVEYDASRLTEHDIAGLLRVAGMEIYAGPAAAA